MDKKRAVGLLNGGKRGIREWNELREEGKFVVDLSSVDLSEANLSGVNLGSFQDEPSQQSDDVVSLKGANLAGADLTKARLEGTRLNEVNLSGCDLKDVVGVTSKQLAEACTDSSTLLPKHLKSELPLDPPSESCRKRWGKTDWVTASARVKIRRR